jgi:hypothetical protein
MDKRIIGLFAVLVIGASAVHGGDDAPQFQSQAWEAFVVAKDAAIARCHATQEYKSAATQRDAKQKALEAARQDGSPQQRLDASSAFVKANEAIKKMEADAVANDPAVAKAQRNVGLAAENEKRALEKAEAARQRAKDSAAHAKYMMEHPAYANAKDAMDAAVDKWAKESPNDKAIADPYARYQARMSRAIVALKILQSYFDQQSTDWKESEFTPLLQDANKAFEPCIRGMNAREQIYPSADAIRAAIDAVKKVPPGVALMQEFDASAKQHEDDPAIAVIDLRAAIKVGHDIDLCLGTATAKAEEARRLLMNREGTDPILPSPKPDPVETRKPVETKGA